ncbi:hypothetical protein H8356DRAFT_1090316 [Neocallimastix lanati (nom. inval.)]|nr:hypothetical protein H8356DRAFT_1090316 [Neocallimastix sp. JGI-2020a]
MIMGKENITRGEIYFEDRRLHDFCEIGNTYSGLCPQYSTLWPSLNVKEILEFYLMIAVDPFTRRFIWNLIKNYKNENRVIMLLTTHSTEEAEYLSDKIAILDKGTLKYIGSPQYLKMVYGKDYILEIFNLNRNNFNFEKEIVISKNLFLTIINIKKNNI